MQSTDQGDIRIKCDDGGARQRGVLAADVALVRTATVSRGTDRQPSVTPEQSVLGCVGCRTAPKYGQGKDAQVVKTHYGQGFSLF
jgi:hypothetical protein